MADLVTNWQPRVGDEGDDRYLLPPSSRILAGRSDIYSNPPTWAQVNGVDASGLNQIVAAINLLKSWHPYLGAALSYVSAGQRVRAATLSDIQQAINFIRLYSFNGIPEWSSTPYIGERIVSGLIADFRRSLALSTWLVPGVSANLRDGSVYSSPTVLGVVSTGYANYSRFRSFVKFTRPNLPPTVSVSSRSLVTDYYTKQLSNNFGFEIYQLDFSLDPFGAGAWDAYLLGSFIGSFSTATLNPFPTFNAVGGYQGYPTDLRTYVPSIAMPGDDMWLATIADMDREDEPVSGYLQTHYYLKLTLE